MHFAVNIMLVDTDAALSNELKGAAANVITVANFAEATTAMDEFIFEYAIINKAVSAFDLAAISFALRQAGVLVIYAAGWAANMASTLIDANMRDATKLARLN